MLSQTSSHAGADEQILNATLLVIEKAENAYRIICAIFCMKLVENTSIPIVHMNRQPLQYRHGNEN